MMKKIFYFLFSEERYRQIFYSRLHRFKRGFYLLRMRNRDLIRRNNALMREVRLLQRTIHAHEDFIFGPILFGLP